MLIRTRGPTTINISVATDRITSFRQTDQSILDVKTKNEILVTSDSGSDKDDGIYSNRTLLYQIKNHQNVPMNDYFSQFLPVRSGYSSQSLGDATRDPSLLTSSAGKSLPETAKGARARMDETYAAMRASGSPFDWNAAEGRERNALFGDLDRRSLLAIRYNVSGLFSSEKQAAARHVMNQQQGLAPGLCAGPVSQKRSFHDPYLGDHTARFNAASDWLSRVNADEIATGEWMLQRTSIDGFLASDRSHTDRDENVLILAELLFSNKDDTETDIIITWNDTEYPHLRSSALTPPSIDGGTGSA